VLYGHNWVVLARLLRHRLSEVIGLPLWATLYVRRRDVPRLPARAGWSFRTKGAPENKLVIVGGEITQKVGRS
ncbi:MAG TPA: hypothetical protein VKP69_25790, partial [Isosphaeraceae bacterium]|nr:hypothetical protein [Isosphaeraceae bacterium]